MQGYLKQSTAATVKLGPFVDSTDGATAETALTISQADVRLSKNGGDFAQKNDATSATHDELGYYDVPLNTTDTNTAGNLLVVVSESGALPVFASFVVLATNIYESLIAATDKLYVDAYEISSSTTAADNVEANITNLNTTISSRATQSSVDTVDDFLDTEIAAIKAKTDLIPAAPASTGDIPTTSQIADAVLDEVYEGTSTLRKWLKVAASVLWAKSSGGGTGTLVFRDVPDTKARVTATVDANGNRSAMSVDET